MSRKKQKVKGKRLDGVTEPVVENKKSDHEIIDAITNGKLDVSIEPEEIVSIEEKEQKEEDASFIKQYPERELPEYDKGKYEWLKINANYIDGSIAGDLFKRNPSRTDTGGYDPAILAVKKKFDWLIKNGYEVHNVTEITLGSYLLFVFRRND